jgi:tryptophanyl-tRNA synthetase
MQAYVAGFQDRRGKVTDETVNEFMAPRPLEWSGNPKIPRTDLVVPVTLKTDGASTESGDGKMSKSQQKKLLKEQQIAQKKADKAKEKEKAAASAQTAGEQ